jgi:hypothetical protein
MYNMSTLLLHILISQASTPDGPEMLFYINSASSPTGEKIRSLTGLPLVSCQDEQKEVVINDSAEGSKEEQGGGACTDDACRISLLSKLNESAESKEGDGEDSEADPKGEEPESVSDMAAIAEEDAPIDMHMMIMDVPNGGIYYRYPCCSELSTIPSAFSPLTVKDSPDVRSWRLSNKKEGKQSKKEGKQSKKESKKEGEKGNTEAKVVVESAVDESKSPSISTLREYCSRTIASSIGYPSSLRTPPSASASSITTEASLKGNQYAQTPVFTLSNLDQITRQFISDYQRGKLIK